MSVDDSEMLAVLADELHNHPPMEVVWKPESVLRFTALIQLALRHPGLQDYPDQCAGAARFLEAVRLYFAECPMTLELIRRGDDQAYDWEFDRTSAPRTRRPPAP